MGSSNMSPLKIALYVVLFIVCVYVGMAFGNSAPGWLVILALLGVVAMMVFFLSGNKK